MDYGHQHLHSVTSREDQHPIMLIHPDKLLPDVGTRNLDRGLK